MRPAVRSLAPALLLVLAACGGVKVVPTGAVPGPARPADCPLEFLYKAPERPYEALADLESHVTAVPKGGAVEVLREKGCALGADAVIVERNQVLNEYGHALVVGTAIRWKPAAPPAPAATPAPEPPPTPAP
jgi:hypothetical protein